MDAPDLERCHICSNTFLSKTALKAHMRIHTGVKPYECPNCGERFRTRYYTYILGVFFNTVNILSSFVVAFIEVKFNKKI